MVKVSVEELSKIAKFVASVDDMINGKFILADVKITKVLNMIADSDELYRYISECMAGFDFAREYHRAEVKNSLNGGVFLVPNDSQKLVAFVFCVLVECDAKRLDFYNFINENFAGETRTDAYKNFSQKLLVPFKEIVSTHFSLGGASEKEVEDMTDVYREDLKNNPVFEDETDQTNFESQVFEQDAWQNNAGWQQQTEQYYQNLNEQNNGDNSIAQNIQNAQTHKIVEPVEETNPVWKEICDICSNIESTVYMERKLKDYLREELLYILKTIKYSTKYEDVRLISAFATAFDELSKKYRSIQFVFGELKNKLQNIYNQK